MAFREPMKNYLKDFIAGILFSIVTSVITSVINNGNAGDTLGSLLFGSLYPSGILGLLLFPLFEIVVPGILFWVFIRTFWKREEGNDYLRLLFFVVGGYFVYIFGIVSFLITVSPDIL